MRIAFALSMLCFMFISCTEPAKSNTQTTVVENVKPVKAYVLFFKQNPSFVSDGFDFPVGKPNANGYYNAQPFMKNHHLGDDWNAVTGGNSDLGDPIYAISNGYVSEAEDFGAGWGKVVRIIHYHDSLNPPYVESLYAHCDSMLVQKGQAVKKGEQIGTIGNADGLYLAHLHFEIRDSIEWTLGGGYDLDRTGYLNPTQFINLNRTIGK